MYRVIKQIVFDTFDKINKRVIFEPEMELDYKRFFVISKPSYLQIRCDDICIDGFIEGPDFPIEDYIEEINEKTCEEYIQTRADRTYRPNQELPYIVQLEMKPSKIETNSFLKTIPGKNVIDIKPLTNNCYLIIYKEIEK